MPNSSNNSSNSLRLGDFISFAAAKLRSSGVDNPDLDARILIAHGLQLDRAQLISQAETELSEKQVRLLSVLIECRGRRESVARIIGRREFWSLSFGLNEATLEPRPDSELLVETTLKHVADKNQPLHILDIGTGTGCLLLSLLYELPKAIGLGLDIAPRAIEQAQENARTLNLSDRAHFQKNDWIYKFEGAFDVIVSNPPYVPHDVVHRLAPEVRDYDPKEALDGGKDGLDCYRHIIPRLHSLLKPQGFCVFEIGHDQAKAVSELFDLAHFTTTAFMDLSGNDRCVLAKIA